MLNILIHEQTIYIVLKPNILQSSIYRVTSSELNSSMESNKIG